MSKIIRISYVIIATISYCVVVWISHDNELLMAFLMTFGLIANILACAPIQIEMEKRREPPALPVFLLLLPFLLYWWGTGSGNFLSLSFLSFFAMSLYLINVGGFLLGLALSPIFSRMAGKSEHRTKDKVKSGKANIKESGFLPFMIFLLAGVLASLYFASDLLVIQMLPFSDLSFYLTISILVVFGLVVIRLTYRSSIWGDPQIYGFYSHKIMKDYLGHGRPEED